MQSRLFDVTFQYPKELSWAGQTATQVRDVLSPKPTGQGFEHIGVTLYLYSPRVQRRVQRLVIGSLEYVSF